MVAVEGIFSVGKEGFFQVENLQAEQVIQVGVTALS